MKILIIWFFIMIKLEAKITYLHTSIKLRSLLNNYIHICITF